VKREAELKARYTAELKRQRPEMVTFLFTSAGAPDRLHIANGICSFWEFKHATPGFASPGIQELFCMRIAAQVHCRYVIWHEDRHGDNQRTLIVHPDHVHDKTLTPEVEWSGYGMKELVRHVLLIHAKGA
jgi:hypothetical protein